MKKIVALLLALMLILAVCTAAADTVVTAKPGDELTMDISIESSSGKSARIGVQTNGAPITFVKAVGGSVNDTVPPIGFSGSFAVVNLEGASISADGSSISGSGYTVASLTDGVIGRLTFRVNGDAAPGVYAVEPVLKSGSVTVRGTLTFRIEEKQSTNRVPGDVTGDGTVNTADFLRLGKYLAGWDNISINFSNTDVNGDGQVTTVDFLRLGKKLAGWDIELE